MVVLDVRVAVQRQVVVLGRLLFIGMIFFNHGLAPQNHLAQALDFARRARALPLRLLELVPFTSNSSTASFISSSAVFCFLFASSIKILDG